MFRRKEDSLFDNTADPSQATPGEAATVVTASPSTSTATPSSSSPASATTAPASRPTAEPRSGFRSSPLSGDMSRNRMPEAKATTAAAATPDKSGKAARRVLTVGNDILLKGEIATCDRLVIEGKVDATLNEVHTVEIAETGSFKGAAHIEDAEISGLFEGDLIVRNRLVIYATGKVRGKISFGEIEIERGGELTGEIKATSTSANASSSNRPARPGAKQDDKVAA